MVKPANTVKVKIDVPDEKWAILVELTGETDPSKVADAALREYIRLHEEDKRNDA